MAISVGTASSWTDFSPIKGGGFHPPTVKSAEGRLRFYASRFDLAEVDSSYYGLPSARNSQFWATRAANRIRFNIKCYRLFFLHQTPPDSLPKDIREAIGPIEKKNLPLTVVRLHGGNWEMWSKKDFPSSADRFNYDHSTTELEALPPHILKISAIAAQTQVLFYNNYEDQAQRSVLALRILLFKKQAAA
jgi:uncharacterized protein YecE (DUF72 family)